jgi:hypothetical protein
MQTEQWTTQVQRQLETKETDELLAIWKKNDRGQWSDAAFEAIGLILRHRIGDALPKQSSPLFQEEIIRHTDTELVLCRSPKADIRLLIGLVSIFILVFVGTRVHWIVGFLFATATLGVLVWIVFGKTLYVFDKSLQRLTVHWWVGKKEYLRHYLLNEILAVCFNSTGDREYALNLEIRSGHTMHLFTGEERYVAGLADTLSDFLGIPLTYAIGGRRIGATPPMQLGTSLNCAKCGGALRPPPPGSTHLTCDYCGTTVLLRRLH